MAVVPAATEPSVEPAWIDLVTFTLDAFAFADRTRTRTYPASTSPTDGQLPPSGEYVPLVPVGEYSTRTLYSPANVATNSNATRPCAVNVIFDVVTPALGKTMARK